jgi:hypothetical protein
LPPGVRLAAGELATKAIADVLPGGTSSVSWAVEVAAGDRGPKTIAAFAVFDAGRRFDARADLTTVCVPTATPTPAPTHTMTPVPTASRTPRPTATATPQGTPPGDGLVCDFVLRRAPRVAIEAALANPQEVHGWLDPLNPGLPPGPGNPLKTWLSLHNIAAPYHPLFNALVYKVGCP